ncbi:MAG: phBC6A51 family helix-turn-helix protein [Desulfitobacteriaceae bacterium]
MTQSAVKNVQKTGHGEKRSRREDLLIAALLTEPSMSEAAKKAGISQSTLFRWHQDPEFHERYREARRQAVSHAITRLQQASTQAVNTLQEIMESNDAPAAAKVSAAKIVLEMSVRAVEMEDLEARIETLEKTAGVR